MSSKRMRKRMRVRSESPDRQRKRTAYCRDPTLNDVRSNPHLLQALQAGYESRNDVMFTRELHPDAPRLPYRRRRGEHKTVIHWGQRKLLLSEIEFLTVFRGSGDCVLFAGSSPGTHVAYLAKLAQPPFYSARLAPFRRA